MDESPFAAAASTDLTAPVMPAGRVLAWIAYRDGLGPYRVLPGELGWIMRWGGLSPQSGRPLRKQELVWDMRWVLARVRWRQRGASITQRCRLPPLGPDRRARLRAIARRQGVGSVASLLPTLKQDVQDARTAAADHTRHIADAERALRSLAATGALSAEGRCGFPDGSRMQPLTTIPTLAWKDPVMRLSPGDMLHPDPRMSRDSRGLPFYHDVQFMTEAVLARWPAPPPLGIEDLPASWTLFEAVAWIALRDPAAVRDAAPAAAQDNTPYVAEALLPDGRRDLVPSAGRTGLDSSRLALEWASRNETTDGLVGPTPTDAGRMLLAALRAGLVTAQGADGDCAEMRTMQPADWHGLRFYERQGTLAARRHGKPGRSWCDVRLERDRIIEHWPGFGDGASVKMGGRSAAQPIHRKKKGKGGNRVSPRVTRVIAMLGSKLGAEGIPSAGDGGQARFERWFIEQVEALEGNISVSRARFHVRRAIELAAKDLGQVR